MSLTKSTDMVDIKGIGVGRSAGNVGTAKLDPPPPPAPLIPLKYKNHIS